MRWRFVFAFLFALPCFALDVVEEGNTHITKNLFFLLDTSGSMCNGKLQKAIDAVVAIATQETDDLNVAVATFGDGTTRWPGKPHTEPDNNPPEGWATLPSKETTDALAKWLGERRSSGGTPVVPALQAALSEKAPKNGALTVILVTDGKFDEQPEVVLSELARLQAMRKSKAVIVCYGINSRDDIDSLRLIAIQSKKDNLLGGYYAEDLESAEPH